LPSGTIIIGETTQKNITTNELRVVTYSRVSTSENKSNLDTQSERLVNYANARGYKVYKIVKEIASGLNDKRPKLTELLKDKSIDIIIVEHDDRLTRFGFNYIETLLNADNRHIEVINPPSNVKEDLIEDFISIITSFCARIYGQRRSKRNTEKMISDLL
jgi:predicted site-specific integrase-resolvase